MSISIEVGSKWTEKKGPRELVVVADKGGRVYRVKLGDGTEIEIKAVPLKRMWQKVGAPVASDPPAYHGEVEKVSDSDHQPPDQGEHLDKEPWVPATDNPAVAAMAREAAVSQVPTKLYMVAADLLRTPAGRYQLVLEFSGEVA